MRESGGEGDGDVGEDGVGVGVDRGDDGGPRRRSSATGSEGERAPSFFFVLDLLPIVGERSNFKIFPTHTQDHGDA